MKKKQDRIIIIAEAGVNHNGDMEIAKSLIDAAATAGADYVKFQTFKADKLTTRSAGKANYQSLATDSICEGQHAMLSRLELSEKDHRELLAHCNNRNIGFLSTAFDIDSLDFLVSLGINLFKIPSGEINNLPYLQHIGKQKGNIILSTGMATLAEIETAINVLQEAGTTKDKITVLHCTTEYPAPIEEVNLRALKTIRAAFKVRVGYSDHTKGIEIALAAAALGASVIEKHFTLNRKLPGPDHQASLEPEELLQMIYSIRNIEKAMGNGIKQPTPSEMCNIKVARKSIVAIRNISQGELFSLENIGIKRPGNGLSPMLWDHVLGKAAAYNFTADELIRL